MEKSEAKALLIELINAVSSSAAYKGAAPKSYIRRENAAAIKVLRAMGFTATKDDASEILGY
jgi:hypothetical protein